MTRVKKSRGYAQRFVLQVVLIFGMSVSLPIANSEVVASLGDVALDADAAMRLIEQSEGSASMLTNQQQRDVIFQNLLRKYLAKQAEAAGLPDQPEVSERIRVLAEEAQLYSAYLRSLVPVTNLTTVQAIGLYRENLEQFQRPQSVSVNQILLTRAGYDQDYEDVVARFGEAMRTGRLNFSDVSSDLGLDPEDQRNAALDRIIAVEDLLPSVREVLADAEIGDVVGPIALDQGAAFIQLNQRLPAGPRAFDEVEQFVRERASTSLRDSVETAFVNKVIEANPITFKSERSWAGWLLEGKRLPRNPEKRVIAEMGDVQYTLAEMLGFIDVLKTTGFDEGQLSEPDYLQEQLVKTRVVRKFFVEQARSNKFDDQPRVKAMVATARRVILSDAWLERLVDEAITEPEQAVIDGYYQENIADYQTPAAVNMSQLFIESGDAAEALVSGFLRSMQDSGTSFKAQAQELLDKEGAVTSTFTEGWTEISDIPTEVFEQIKGLTSGGLSAPINVASGVIFIQVNQIQRGGVIPLEQIREKVEAEYVAQQRLAERNRRVSALQEELIF